MERLPDREAWIDARFTPLAPDAAAEALEARRVARDVAGELWETRRRNLDAVWESTTKAIDDYFQLQIDEHVRPVMLEHEAAEQKLA